jgi:hypothetical protein
MDTTGPVASNALLEEYEREQREQAEAMMAHWDRGGRRTAAWLLSMVWVSVGGVTVFPAGLLFGLMMLLPGVHGWTFGRKWRFAGRRVWPLFGFAAASLLFALVRVTLLDPATGVFGLRFSFRLLPWG